MRIAPFIIAASLAFGTSAFAQAGVSGPNLLGSNAAGAKSFSPTATSVVDLAAKHKKKKRKHVTTGSGAEAGPNNSTGNMNTKGTGRGTTGTGGPGGSGNK